MSTEELILDLRRYLDKRLDAMDIKFDILNEKVDSSYNKLDAKIDAVHDKLDNKIDAVHDKLDAKIDAVHDKLDAKIDKLSLDVGDALELYYGDHDRRIVRLESRKA